MDYEEVTYEDGDDWVEKVYKEDGVKVTRYKPSWYKEPDKFNTTFRSKARKPTFGPKDP
jgi:hypothetical protein|tara:strand:- start:58 stop:234 length:177 start_codon:yes stop_codon:yes gene_type:complete